MYHQLQPSSTTQLFQAQPHCIPYDRNLYLTVTSPDLPAHDREILSSKALTEITSVITDFKPQHMNLTIIISNKVIL